MAKQMLIDATRGKQTEMPPWLPYAGVHCAALIDQPADAFLKDAELLAARAEFRSVCLGWHRLASV